MCCTYLVLLIPIFEASTSFTLSFGYNWNSPNKSDHLCSELLVQNYFSFKKSKAVEFNFINNPIVIYTD